MAQLMQITVAALALLLAGSWVAPAAAQCPSRTTIQDTLQNADGTPASGRVVIAWPTFRIGTCQVVAGQMTVPVADGNLAVELFPNELATPEGTSYRVTYYLRSGRISTEYWVVPVSPTPVPLAIVRSASLPVPAVQFSMAQVTDLLPTLNRKVELPPLCSAGKFLQANGSATPPQVDCVDGTGAPRASATISGTVKTDVSETDPVVYTKTTADTLLAGKANATHTHSAQDITAGTLSPARLPAPTATTLGGVLANSCPGSDKVTGISTSGALLCGADLGGGTGSTHQIDGVNLTAQDPVNFLDTAEFDWTNPSAGNVQIALKTGSVTGAKIADGAITDAKVATNAAIAESKLALNFPTHSNANDPTAGEKAALAGTAGVPSATNRYVTDADPRNSNARTPTAHASTHQHGGTDEVATATPAANAIPKADATGRLAVGWLPNDTTLLGSLIDLGTETAGTLPVSQGGTGAGTFTTHGVLLGNGTGAITATAAGTANQVLRVPAAGGAPTFGAVNLASPAAVAGILPEANIDAAIARDNEINLTNLGGGVAGANSYDFSGAAATMPVRSGNTLPATCVANKELFIDTDATPGQQLFICNATGNGWNLVGDGGGAGGDTTKTHTLEMVCDTPRTTTLAGNAFWTVSPLAEWDWGHWEFLRDVDGKIYCHTTIPETLATVPNPVIILRIAANATTGVTRLSIRSFVAGDGESLNPATTGWTAAPAQDITVPATARTLKDVTFTTLPTLAARKILVVEVFHEGAHANDTLAANTELFKVLLRVNLTQ
ncbi:MAG: hypothetical protein K6U09_06830 [Acidobacteriia bacterium]|jgi:hypothetical protein|nr:hypothetical protein [Terriglobia bacterium]